MGDGERQENSRAEDWGKGGEMVDVRWKMGKTISH